MSEAMQAQMAKRYTPPFLAVYFLYYSAYALFSSYMVSYLVQRGMSATLCGGLTSITLLVSVFMQPVAGYLTDTFLSTRQYLQVSVGAIVVLCVLNTLFDQNDVVCVLLIVLTAAFAYPFVQLMDAWVNCARELDETLIYSRVRAGGSIGFATVSVLAGHFFHAAGYKSYFLLQAAIFILILPFLKKLPRLALGNRKKGKEGESHLGFFASFSILLHRPQYAACLVLFSLYWMSHRPIGSYLALICASYGGGDALFGNVCGVGSFAEFLLLLLIVPLGRKMSLKTQLATAFLLCLVRPALLLTGKIPLLYAGHIAQSLSFAFFFAASTACFTRFADPRIRSFSISVGLTVTSVLGTVCANFTGGIIYDMFGAKGNLWLSLILSMVGIAFFSFFAGMFKNVE